MSDIGDQFKIEKIDEELLTGTVKEWYEDIIDEELECERCENQFTVKKEMIGFHTNGEKVSILDRFRQKMTGENPHNYNIPEYTVKSALFTEDGKPVNAVIQCPDCLNLHGHNNEFIMKEYPIPESKWSK